MATDETLYENVTVQNGQELESPVIKDKKNVSNAAKRAAAVGAGVLVGGGAAYAVSSMAGHGGANHQEGEQEEMQVIDEGSDKSFDEAFNDARAHLGPGGAFRWNGGLYSTYTESEWNSMSEAERAEYGHHAQEIASGTERIASTYEETHTSHIESPTAHAHHVVDPKPTPEPEPHPTPEPDSGLKIESEEVMEVEGRYIIRATGTYNGRSAMLYDLDGDGKYDGLIVDNDGNGFDDKDPVYDLSDQSVPVQDKNLVAQIHHNPTSDTDPVFTVGNEEVVEIDGKTVVMGEGSVDGKSAVLIDYNMDGKYDAAVIDSNGNGALDDDDQRVDLRGHGVNVHNSGLLAQQDPAMNDPSLTDANLPGADGMPDYSPDAV